MRARILFLRTAVLNLHNGCVCVVRMHQAMQSVMKRVKHGNPAVQIHALTVSILHIITYIYIIYSV